MEHPTYIVLWPGMRANPTEQFAVVSLDEWLAVWLGDQEHYENISEHPDYASAAARLGELNPHPQDIRMMAHTGEDEIVAA